MGVIYFTVIISWADAVDISTDISGILLYKTAKPFMPGKRLPLGPEARDYFSTIKVSVSDCYDEKVTVTLQVKVSIYSV